MTTSVEIEPVSSENGYDLTDEQVAQLTSELLEDRPPVGNDRFICYMVDGADRYANIGRKIECDVFDDAFDNDPEEMAQEYGPYEIQSKFFLSIDREEEVPTGVLRIIKNGPAGLKTFNDLKEIQSFSAEKAVKHHHINLDDCWDLGTVAVPKRYRAAQGGVSLQLYRGMYVASQKAEVRHFISMIDDGPYQKMTRFLGFPFKPLYGSHPGPYLGSAKSHPVYGDAPNFEKAVRHKGRTLQGLLARKALAQLGKGTKDSALQF